MTERSLKMGVVGVGSLGQHHARICSELPEIDLVGIYDVDEKRAAKTAARCTCKVFGSLEEVAEETEAASIVVPTDRHRDIAAPFLARGRHLLVEKPIAATTAEAEEMVALAREHDAILQVGHVERFNPVLNYLDTVDGHPRFIEAHRLAPYPPARPGLPPRGTEVSVVLDLMIHDLEVVLHLVRSPVKDFHAVGVPVLSPSEDIANARLIFENGCVANVTASRISPERMRKIRVFYSAAYISLDYQDQAGELYRTEGQGISREKIPIEKGDALTNELRSFAECVLARHEPVVSGQQASDALRLAVDIQQSMQEGTP